MTDESRSDRIEAIMRSFANALPDKISAIEDQWQKAQPSCKEAELGKLRELCHSLAGSAATFEYNAIGDCARGLEQVLRVHLEKRNGDEPLNRDFVRKDIRLLRELVNKAV